MVRKLKKFFNTKFSGVFEEKEEILQKIGLLNERLKAVILELRYSVFYLRVTQSQVHSSAERKLKKFRFSRVSHVQDLAPFCIFKCKI